jgi:signal transduction histidine kinase
MAITLTSPWRVGQVLRTIFGKTNQQAALEQRIARLEQYQSMQHTITQIIARSTELEVAIPNIIQTICETIGWDLGEVWHVDHEADWLFCEANWHVPSFTCPTFARSALDLTFRQGKGLPGRVWAIGKPAWINDVVVDTNFLRASLAERDGLHAGFGIPLRTEGTVIGVMTFFSRRILAMDRDLMRVLETIGSQIGLFIERKRIEQVEQAQTRQLSAMHERQRLARDLHDSVTQTLFSANMIAEMLPQIWDRDPEQVRPGLDELQRLTRGALGEMRSLLVELRPAGLQSSSLTEMLNQLATSVTSSAKLHITLESNEQATLPPDVRLTLFRITQEALNNIVKHAHANRVWIQLHADCERLELQIRDDGRGFKSKCLPSGHFGMAIMRERAEEIGAQFQLNSIPSKGTSITITR